MAQDGLGSARRVAVYPSRHEHDEHPVTARDRALDHVGVVRRSRNDCDGGAVARDRELLRPEVGEDEVKAILRASSPSIGFYSAAIALAIVAPRAAAFGYLLIAVVAALRVRGDEPAAQPS